MAITANRVDRARPPFIRQADLNWCWAATLEAWSRVDARWGSVRRQSEWVADPGLQPHLHPQTRAINIRTGMPYLRDRFHLVGNVWNTAVSTKLTKHVGAPTRSQLRDTLRHSHALAVFQVIPGAASHVVLVYSIDQSTVCYMDPFAGFQTANVTDVATSPLVMLHR